MSKTPPPPLALPPRPAPNAGRVAVARRLYGSDPERVAGTPEGRGRSRGRRLVIEALAQIGSRPYVSLAFFLHVAVLIALFSIVTRVAPEPDEEVAALPLSLVMMPATDDPTEPADTGGGDPTVFEPVDTPPAPAPAADEPQPTPADPATSREQPDTDMRTETGRAPVIENRPSESLRDALNGGRIGGAADGAHDDAPAPGLGLRTPLGRTLGVRLYGGTPESEDAVAAGLRWLAHHQHEVQPNDRRSRRDRDNGHDDPSVVTEGSLGYWRPDRFHADARDLQTGRRVFLSQTDVETGSDAYRMGVTGLATLAFLGTGNTHRSGDYRDVVGRAIRWILREQNPTSGAFASDGAMYNHALALYAVAECYLLSRDERLLPALRAGLRFALTAQQRTAGWDYRAATRMRSDTSITSWVLLALVSCEEAGLDVPRASYLRIIRHFQRVTQRDGYTRYATSGGNADQTGAAMLATSLLCRQLLGQTAGQTTVDLQTELLLTELPDRSRLVGSNDNLDQNHYAWYIANLALFIRGGDAFSQWNGLLRSTLVGLQRASGQVRGSWEAVNTTAGSAGGTVYATAISVLALETYYRYRPEYLRTRGASLRRYWDDPAALANTVERLARQSARDAAAPPR